MPSSSAKATRFSPLNVCIQVNISGEDSKSGISLAELPDVVEVLLKLIKNPQYTSKSVYLSLSRSGMSISRDFVDRVFDQYFPGKKNS